jgi:hypothetical protein
MAPRASQGPDEVYADPGYQKDNEKRYPLTLNGKPDKGRIQAAYSYISQKSNQAPYTDNQVKAIMAKIMTAGNKMGISYKAGS